MNDLLLDAMPEKPRLFNQIETLKKEATSLVDNAIRRTISSHAEMAESLKKEATFPVENAIALFKQGQISSRMAAKWLNMPRVTFLMLAMEAGAELLDNTPEDFERETALL